MLVLRPVKVAMPEEIMLVLMLLMKAGCPKEDCVAGVDVTIGSGVEAEEMSRNKSTGVSCGRLEEESWTLWIILGLFAALGGEPARLEFSVVTIEILPQAR